MLEQTEEGPAEAAELGGYTYGPDEGCSGVDQCGSGGCEDLCRRAARRVDGLDMSWERKRRESRMGPALGLSS